MNSIPLPLSILIIIMIALMVEVLFRIIGNFSEEMSLWFWYLYIGGSLLFAFLVFEIFLNAVRAFLENREAMFVFLFILVVAGISGRMITQKPRQLELGAKNKF